MNDARIIQLIWERDEEGLRLLEEAYGPVCRSAAFNILRDREDAEECVDDAMLAVWETVPRERPESLTAVLLRIVRNKAIDRLRKRTAGKRGDGAAAALEELEDLPAASGRDLSEGLEARELGEAIGRFVQSLPETERRIFLCRYWYLDPLQEIADRFGYRESRVRSLLFRLRKRLKKQLEKEGYFV